MLKTCMYLFVNDISNIRTTSHRINQSTNNTHAPIVAYSVIAREWSSCCVYIQKGDTKVSCLLYRSLDNKIRIRSISWPLPGTGTHQAERNHAHDFILTVANEQHVYKPTCKNRIIAVNWQTGHCKILWRACHRMRKTLRLPPDRWILMKRL